MATKTQFLKSCRNAVISKKIALTFHHHTTDVGQRIALCRDICRDRGISNWEQAGQLLEYLAYASRITTSQFGAWDADTTVSMHLGWRSRDQVKRIKRKLIDAGLIETGLGIPLGRTAPCTHYRLTTFLGKLMKRLTGAIRRAQSLGKALAPSLKKLLPVQATKTAAHQQFKQEPPRKRSTLAVAGAYLASMRQLVRGGATE